MDLEVADAYFSILQYFFMLILCDMLEHIFLKRKHSFMTSDIAIAQKAKMLRITEVAKRYDIDEEFTEPYGHYKAKINLDFLETLKDRPNGKLVMVTAISPTPAGEGKTTTSIGLGDALNRLGKKTIICLREPSMGPVFGMKGGAAGGGYSQVVPMEDINLHFTGDISAVSLANNLLSALIDNHIHQGNELGIDVRRIVWKRAIDMNDRSLRNITIGLGGPGNSYPRSDGFDIAAASEIMAIFCLANNLQDMKERLGNIVVAYSRDRKPILASDLKAHGAMAALLKDAIKPNMVQTLENNLAFIHGGPFANIATGCNSVIATKSALKLADYVVTESGFGADLGAEKFVDIVCRKSGLRPDCAVLVVTIRALKYHGGVNLPDLSKENLDSLEKGISHLERHIQNIREHYGLPCVVCINHFTLDTDAEIQLLKDKMASRGTPIVVSKHWSQGGQGAEELAQAVIDMIDTTPSNFKFVYDENMSLWDKTKTLATKLYGAKDIVADSKVKQQIRKLEEDGYGKYPICVAKTQYSFSTDRTLRGVPKDHLINIREVQIAAGAEFIVVYCGDIMTMPGLPRIPSSNNIDIDANGHITGLF